MATPDETYFIGEINFEESFGKVYVYNNEGKYIPHFHLVMDGQTDICIMLTDNRYFTHGKHNKMLSSNKDCRILNEWLKKKPTNAFSRTNWEFAVSMWNATNNVQIDIEHVHQPDYSTIKPYK